MALVWNRGAAAETQDDAFSQTSHQLTDAISCPLEALPVEIVALIARQCLSARDQAAFAQASKWLNDIVNPIILKTICVDGDWSVIFWAAEHGCDSLLQKLEDINKKLHDAGRISGWPIAEFIDWNMFGRQPQGRNKRPHHLWEYAKSFSLPHDPFGIPNAYREHSNSSRAFCTPLHLAVLEGHLDTVRFLVERGADIQADSNRIGLWGLRYDEVMPEHRSDKGMPPLFGPRSGTVILPLVPPFHRPPMSLVRPAIAVTPLVLATYRGEYDTAQWLLQHGASSQFLWYSRREGNTLRATLLHLLSKFEERSDTPPVCGDARAAGSRRGRCSGLFWPHSAGQSGGDGGGDSLLETLVTLGANVNYVIPAKNGAPAKSLLEHCIRGHLDTDGAGWWQISECRSIVPRLRGARRLIELGADPEIRGGQLSVLSQCRILAGSRLYLEQLDELKALHEFMAFLEAKFPGFSAAPRRDLLGLFGWMVSYLFGWVASYLF
ncbi:hypothetical protein PG996_015513 [Apiospora saccharicola]|uniref:Ankyrin n=1 Tax=Apiospora saccharicola TaxID=335842 RepID=A0ABR1TP01_9PEZI